MTTRKQLITISAISAIIALIVVPVLVVQAQSEGEMASTSEATSTEVVASQEEATVEPAATEEAASGEAPSAEGEVLGESDVAAEEPSVPAESAATTTETELLVTASASSTDATSTPPVVEEPKPVEEPFVLQPGVELSINGKTVNASITLENLTCKSCEKVLPELEVLAYYTEWYPNDGPVKDYSQSSVHAGKQARSVGDVPNGAARDLTWSAEIPSGHYYFVVEVDPENANGAYRLFRSEFSI